MTGTPMRAAMPNEQGVGLSESMQAVYDSIKNDEEARLQNVQLQNQLPQQLAQFSQTASNLGNTLFQKRIEDISAKALYDARMDGSISQEQIASYDAEVNDINSNHRTIEKAADSIEQADQHDIVAERVRSTDPYYQYYYKLGQLRNQVSELPMLHAQLKDTLTIRGADGRSLTYDEITEYDDMAAWNAQAEVYMNRAFAGVSPVLAAKEIFPQMDELFTRDAQKWATANAKKRKDARLQTESANLFNAIEKVDQTLISSAFNNHTGTLAEKFAPAESLAKRGALDSEALEAFGNTPITDRATGKETTIAEKFPLKFSELEVLANKGLLDAQSLEDRNESNAFLAEAEEAMALFNDEDGVTLGQISKLEDYFLSTGNPNALTAVQYLSKFKRRAVDYYDQAEEQQLYLRIVQGIDEGYYDAAYVEENTGGELRQRLRQYLVQEGKGSQVNTRKVYEVAYISVKKDIESKANVTPLSGSDGSVDFVISLQHQVLDGIIQELQADPVLSKNPNALALEAKRRWTEQWEKMLKDNPNYFSEESFQGVYNELPYDKQSAQRALTRMNNLKNLISKTNADGGDLFSKPELLYNKEQFAQAVKDFRNGEPDTFTEVIARQTNLTPYEVLAKLQDMYPDVNLPPVAPEIRDAMQQMSPEQKAFLNRNPNAIVLGRFRGERQLVADASNKGTKGPTGALTYKDNADSYLNTGRALEAAGFQVAEHSSFGGTAPVHAPNSYHKYDEAFDITHQTGEYNASIEKTARLQKLISSLDLFVEVIGPLSNDPNHKTHLHLGGLKRVPTAEEIQLLKSFK